MPVRGGGKSPLRILLTIALVFATPFIPEITIPLLSAQIATGIAVAVVGFVGMMLINAIAPIRPPKAQKQDSPTYQITGARNQLAPYSPAMVVLGKHRVFPSLGAKYYTEIVGDDEYMRVLLYMAGPVKIDDIRIGDTPIASYPGFDDGTSSLEVREDGSMTRQLRSSRMLSTRTGSTRCWKTLPGTWTAR